MNEKNQKLKQNRPVKPKVKRKLNKVNLWAVIVSCVAIIGLVCLTIGLIVIVGMLKSKPELDVSEFTNSESSVIYDEDGNQIAELGTTIRENVTYDDLPNVLVDAFVATEDSRYFEHNGFDVPRFAKAFLSNLKTMSFSQGGSTFTMQLVKNTYFSNDETGQSASRSGLSGVTRKVQEIALAMELEKSNEVNKKTILELYLNKLNFGGNRNIRGIQKASEYYFGKDVSDLNLAESALLAGVINAPNAYNPFNNLELATQRRNEVLYLMKYHGYITEDEYQLARSIKVEDLLIDYTETSSGGSVSPYQAYIDQVISETYTLTGKDPYTTGMRIYTYMNKAIQKTMDSIQEENYDGIAYPDDEFEIASIAVNNQTGAIVGILGGRNYASGGSLLLNHATEQKKQPGSAIKPILDYVLAFENLGWSTSHVLVDKPITYAGTSIVVANANGYYSGQVTLRDALGNSLNTPAIQTLQAVIDAKGKQYVVDYLNSMGIEISYDDFDIQCGIGGNKITVSCLDIAGAQAALLNLGQYTKPHTISRIEFLDGKSPITPTYTTTQTISSEAAYMMDTLLESNVSGGYANLMQILIDDYKVYAKTGTTDWGTSGQAYGIPTGAIKDAWMVASSTNYTVATWIGYEKAQKDKQSYITVSDYLTNIQGKTTNAILDKTVSEYGSPTTLERPSGVVSITHILGTYPYAATIEDMDSQYITTGYIKKEYATLVDPQTANISSMDTNPTISYDGTKLKITWPKYPDESALKEAEDTMDISLTRSDGSVIIGASGKRLFDYSWVYGPVRYKAEIKVNGTSTGTVSSETEENSFDVTATAGDKITACAYYGYEKLNISSSQKCVDVTVEDRDVIMTIPNTTDTSEIKAYLENLGAKVDVIEKTGDSESLTISDSNGKSYSIGISELIKQSALSKLTFTITKTSKATVKIALTTSDQGGSIIRVSANKDVANWTYVDNDGACSENSNYIDVDTSKLSDSITIMATDSDGNTASIEVKPSN